eukprot:CAMPEP_0174700992 /NCGR_PEP_ID=MMETSP1094-20130205/5768_1 /TAXON_ID=156173 /ORGANISM="Chrysochromulina brevifilum, Strain UTEX LB 985" /LENGTH=213 /DNA_ID=CAMNT_0015898565 /DNA_START=515 /DNA_END=1156 /DNA_ORIENTATION=-
MCDCPATSKMSGWGNAPKGTVRQYLVIISSYDATGDSPPGPPPCCYLAFCGPEGGDGQGGHGGNAYDYACCCGCNIADVLALPTATPSNHRAAMLACLPSVAGALSALSASLLSHLRAVYTGNCMFDCPDFVHGPGYDRSAWYSEDAPCDYCSILIDPEWECGKKGVSRAPPPKATGMVKNQQAKDSQDQQKVDALPPSQPPSPESIVREEKV